jgi:ribulose-phosphate 3-epimerase
MSLLTAKKGSGNEVETLVKIAPSILAADFAHLAEDVAKISNADMLHVDIMDGSFVPNLTIGPPVVSALRKTTDLAFDCHLMVSNCDVLLEPLAAAGADYVTVHAEACVHLHRTLMYIKELGMGCGVALNPSTPLTSIEWVLDLLDLVLIMTVNPGFGGQSFITRSVEKIARLQEEIKVRGLKTLIAVDGGINLETAPVVHRAGADVLIAGSYVFSSPDPALAVEQLRAVTDKVGK